MSSLKSVLRLCPALQRATSTKLGVRSLSSKASRFDRSAKLEDESVMEHLVCPISKYPLRYDTERGSLVCDEINVEYPIWRDVPLLVPSEGRIIGSSNDGDHE
ncbi:hypothetical protein PF010_g10029 [Phytophthora fragariae]|uniref:Protein preY, mitochondrial n=1 Tax=Phytophthora fragariae TaxID=53985 RepID=A0A6G0LAI6_9STRA|nr:hypothetical protein PF010_g10029 [Phytophthora fragariae]KAE9233361.1 hypothetical protein PF004_g9685 [Phytophthora fragariae]